MAEKKEIKYETKLYLGKDFKKKGTDKNGNEWKLYEFRFEKYMDNGNVSQYPFKCKGFGSIGTKENSKSLTIDELEEGEEYLIGYTEQELNHPEHGPYTSRTIVFFGVPNKEQNVDNKMNSMAKEENVETLSQDEQDFIDTYHDAIKKGTEITNEDFILKATEHFSPEVAAKLVKYK